MFTFRIVHINAQNALAYLSAMFLYSGSIAIKTKISLYSPPLCLQKRKGKKWGYLNFLKTVAKFAGNGGGC